MAASDQLLDILQTISETEAFLRKRCAAGLAGQSMGLFEDLASLIEMVKERFEKTEFLPKRAPAYFKKADMLGAVDFLDQVEDWSKQIRERIKRYQIRLDLARGTLPGVPMENKANLPAAADLIRPPQGGTPEERAAGTESVQVDFSRGGSKSAPAGGVNALAAAADLRAAVRQEESPGSPEVDEPQESGTRRRGFNSAAESARLFAALRGGDPQEKVDGQAEQKPRTRPMPRRTAGQEEGEGGARPMAAHGKQEDDTESGVRPMAAHKPPEAEAPRVNAERAHETGGARPMAANRQREGDTESGARPMRPKQPQAEGGANPAERNPPEPAAESGAKPMAARRQPPSAAQPMQAPAAQEPGPQVGGSAGIDVDRQFTHMMDEIAGMDETALSRRLIDAFPALENRYKIVIVDYIRRYGYWGKLVPDRNDYEALRNRASALCRHREDFIWLYGKLGDYRSRKTLLAVLDNWYSFNLKSLSNMKDKVFPAYLDADLLRPGPDEVFVDGGAYIGEVTKSFMELAGSWRKIYCYDLNDGNCASLRANFEEAHDVEIRRKGIAARPGMASVASPGDPALCRLSPDGSEEIETVTLDENLEMPATILKLCLEGGEQDAIKGASDIIHRARPRVAVRADHNYEDLWKLPRMLEGLNPKYRFYLRHYGGNLVPAEFVIYAV